LQASVIYSNLGAGDSYSTTGYLDGSNEGPFSLATEFTASATGNLGQVLTPIADALGSMTFDLYSDAAGQPGTLLEERANVPVDSSLYPFGGTLVTLISALNPLLTAGDNYWFTATSAETEVGVGWNVNTQGVLGGFWATDISSTLTLYFPTSPTPAIEVDSVSAPEPAAWILLTGGLALLLVTHRTRKPNSAVSSRLRTSE
jgi:hypothetical protein